MADYYDTVYIQNYIGIDVDNENADTIDTTVVQNGAECIPKPTLLVALRSAPLFSNSKTTL